MSLQVYTETGRQTDRHRHREARDRERERERERERSVYIGIYIYYIMLGRQHARDLSEENQNQYSFPCKTIVQAFFEAVLLLN